MFLKHLVQDLCQYCWNIPISYGVASNSAGVHKNMYWTFLSTKTEDISVNKDVETKH